MKNDRTFKQSMERLDEIVVLLEKNDVELEEAISLYEEALVLMKKCDEQLNQFEHKVSDLMATYQEEDPNGNME